MANSKSPRIALLSVTDRPIAFFDNSAPDGMQYFNDCLHTYLQGGQYTFEFTTFTDHPNAQFIEEGKKIAFRYTNYRNGRKFEDEYYCTIVRVERNEQTIRVLAYGLILELTLEHASPFKVGEKNFAQALEQYKGIAELKALNIGINEVYNNTVSYEWKDDESLLARLYKMAETYNCEIGFTTHLNNDYTLAGIDVDLYHKHDDDHQGMGYDRTDHIIRYGRDCRGISRTSDITELYNALDPSGKVNSTGGESKTQITHYYKGDVEYRTVTRTTISTDGRRETTTTTKQGANVKTVVEIVTTTGGVKETTKNTSDNGLQLGQVPSSGEERTVVENQDNSSSEKFALTLKGFVQNEVIDGFNYFVDANGTIRCPDSRNLFPSTMQGFEGDGYICYRKSYSNIEGQAELYAAAIKELAQHTKPKLTYDVDVYVDAHIGDTFTIYDEYFNPPLYTKARVVEQEICFTDPTKSKTHFDNFTEMESQISDDLTTRMQEMIDETRIYDVYVSASNGTVFKNGIGVSTLTAYVRDKGVDKTESFNFDWYKNEKYFTRADSITIAGDECGEPLVVKVQAVDIASELVRGSYELTLTSVDDGLSDYLHIRYSNDGGATFTGNSGKDPGDWLGQYHDMNPVDSENPKDYTWTKIKGDKGDTAQQLVSISTQYYLSSSNEECTGGQWLLTMPTFDYSKYLWTRQRALYRNPEEVAYTEPILDPIWKATQEAIGRANDAVDKANDANDKAQGAIDDANKAVNDLKPFKDELDEAKRLAQEAKDEATAGKEEILSDIKANYATKTDVTEITGELESQIKANADEISTKVSETTYQQNRDDIDERITLLSTNLIGKENDLTTLLDESSEAKKALDEARKHLEELINAGATQSEIDAANDALQEAETVFNETLTKIEEAKKALNDLRNDIDSLKSSTQEMSTQINQTAQDITMLITNNKKNEDDISEIHSYFKFSEDGLDIGKTTDGQESTVLKLQNDSVSFVSNGQAVAYFKDKSFMIENGEILKSLKLGRYAFIPRANGSLDFKLVEKGE